MPTETNVQTLDAIFQTEGRGVYARLVHSLGDFDIAEDALQDAMAAALVQWPKEGIPDKPHAWLFRVARFKAIDALRKKGRTEQVEDLEPLATTKQEELEEIGDEVLRLIFTCCHPSIGPEAQIALTLREVCGLTTEEIARAFLIPAPTVAQRIVRAKNKIREAKIPFEVPGGDDKNLRLAAVLRTIYLVFNEGYSASSGEEAIRRDLVVEAIRLARLLNELLPDPEVLGLLALMLLSQSRMSSRLSREGEIVVLEDQDRSLWDRDLIAQGARLVTEALNQNALGSYILQAAISSVHCEAPSYEETDWNDVVGLYDALLLIEPSPVVSLNRAVAVAMRDGPEAGIALIDALLADGQLGTYHLAFAARAYFYRRAGKTRESIEDYSKALGLASNEPEKRFLQKQLDELAG
ncbi:MAG TPA: RNA polymerase sigma factor [Fimbriimonadaceae bacterium]